MDYSQLSDFEINKNEWQFACHLDPEETKSGSSQQKMLVFELMTIFMQ